MPASESKVSRFFGGPIGTRHPLASYCVGDRVLIRDGEGNSPRRPGRITHAGENKKGKMTGYLVRLDGADETVLANHHLISLVGPALPGQGD